MPVIHHFTLFGICALLASGLNRSIGALLLAFCLKPAHSDAHS